MGLLNRIKNFLTPPPFIWNFRDAKVGDVKQIGAYRYNGGEYVKIVAVENGVCWVRNLACWEMEP